MAQRLTKDQSQVINKILLKRLLGPPKSMKWLENHLNGIKESEEEKNRTESNYKPVEHSPLAKNNCTYTAFINESTLRNVWKLEQKNTLFNYRLVEDANGQKLNKFKRTGTFICTHLVPLETFKMIKVQQINSATLDADKTSNYIKILDTPENRKTMEFQDGPIFPDFIPIHANFASNLALSNDAIVEH